MMRLYNFIKNKKKKEENKFNIWLDTILKDNIPSDIKNLIFKMKTSDNNVQILLIGSNVFITNYDFVNSFVYTNNKIFNCNTTEQYKDIIIKSFIEEYLKFGKYSDELKKYDSVSIILPNGLINVLYLNNNIQNNLEKYKKIEFSKFLNVNEILYKYKFEEFIDYSIGYDNKIYLMFIKNNKYFVMTLLVNWDEYNILKINITEINVEVKRYYNNYVKYNLIRPLKNNYLLVAPRLENEKSTTEKNALVIDKTGNMINSICLGDDIDRLITTNDGEIIVTYGDEGLYGANLLSNTGMNIWNADGRLLYKNKKYMLDDCTKINFSDKLNKLYFYDGNNNIIISDLKKDFLIESYNLYNDFLINLNNETSLLFFLPVYKFNELKYAVQCKIEEKNRKITQEKFWLIDIESNVKIEKYNFRGSKILALGNDNILYGYEFK